MKVVVMLRVTLPGYVSLDTAKDLQEWASGYGAPEWNERRDVMTTDFPVSIQGGSAPEAFRAGLAVGVELDAIETQLRSWGLGSAYESWVLIDGERETFEED